MGVDVFKTRNHSGDSNLWCREFESGTLDDPEHFSTPEEQYNTWTALGLLGGGLIVVATYWGRQIESRRQQLLSTEAVQG